MVVFVTVLTDVRRDHVGSSVWFFHCCKTCELCDWKGINSVLLMKKIEVRGLSSFTGITRVRNRTVIP